jgi:threonine/homoserine/homoserine lactone efflux protein
MADAAVVTYFLQGAALGFSAAVTPGPLQAFLIAETLSGGWRRGLPITFAPLISDLPVILLSLLVLNQVSELFLGLVSIAGGIFILYLAWRLWQDWRKGPPKIDEVSPSTRSSIWRGVAVNLLGPGPYLFWALVSGPILLSALRQSIFAGLSFLTGFYGLMVISLLAIVVLFHQTRRLGERVVHVMLLISILILVIFALLIFWQVITGSYS